MEDLEAWLHEELTADAAEPAAIAMVTGLEFEASHVAVPKGAYRVAIKCGMLASAELNGEIGLGLETPDARYEVVMACPSTVVRLDERFDFAELTPVVLELLPGPSQHQNAVGVAVAFVPEEV